MTLRNCLLPAVALLVLVLLGLAAIGQSSAGTNTTLNYASLRITISPTTAASLSPTFAANLPQPQTVLDVANLSVNWQAGAFTPITFVNSYTHDGQSALVIDIQKVVAPIGDASCKTIQNSRRTDLPPMINAFGLAGSGAHAAAVATATANSPISLELRWAGAAGAFTPTLKLKSDPTAPFRAPFGIGRPVDVITQGEFESQMRIVSAELRARGRAAPPEDALRSQLLERMVLERLQVQLAVRMAVCAPELLRLYPDLHCTLQACWCISNLAASISEHTAVRLREHVPHHSLLVIESSLNRAGGVGSRTVSYPSARQCQRSGPGMHSCAPCTQLPRM